MNLFIIPHAHTEYTKQCLYPIFDQIIPNFTRIIYVSTLHLYAPNIIINTMDFNDNKLPFFNDIEYYARFHTELQINNKVQQKEHSFYFNIPFLTSLIDRMNQKLPRELPRNLQRNLQRNLPKNSPRELPRNLQRKLPKKLMNKPNKMTQKITKKIPICVFYIHTEVNPGYFFDFVADLNRLYQSDYLYLFNSDFSHLNYINEIQSNPVQFPYIRDELNKREMPWIHRLMANERPMFQNEYSKFIGCGGAVIAMVSHLNFINTGKLLCKTDSQTKVNYLKYSNSIPNSRQQVVSYVTIGYSSLPKIMTNHYNILWQYNKKNDGYYTIYSKSKQRICKGQYKTKTHAIQKIEYFLKTRKCF